MLKSLNPNLLSILAELRSALEILYGSQLDCILLFGSQARGDAQPDSDVDILIVLQSFLNYSQEIERTSQLIADLSLKHNKVISRVFIERERFQSQDSLFLRNIHREGVPL